MNIGDAFEFLLGVLLSLMPVFALLCPIVWLV